MVKVLVAYYSLTGNTARMAEAVAEGVRSARAEAELNRVEEVKPDDLVAADGIIIGSPTYYAQTAAQVKTLFDRSSDIRGLLENKVEAAFTSSASLEGGNQTTLISILESMIIHAMVVVGDPTETGHFGAIAVGEPDERALQTCRKTGARVAKLAAKISS